MMFLIRCVGFAALWMAWWTVKPIFKAIRDKELQTWKRDELVGRSCAAGTMLVVGLVLVFRGVI